MNFLDYIYENRSVKSQSEIPYRHDSRKTNFLNIAVNEGRLLYFNLLAFYKTWLIILGYDHIGLLR